MPSACKTQATGSRLKPDIYVFFTRKEKAMNTTTLEREPKALARSTDPATSKEAAGRVKEFANNHQAQILAVLRDHPFGLTVHEIAAFTRLDAHAIGKRMAELQSVGAVGVVRNLWDLEVTRTSPSGRQARVWEILGGM
jgi:hypothetical protein